MKQVKGILTAILMAAILAFTALAPASALGQKGNDKRPPKEPSKIKETPKPPPSNSNNQGNSNRGRGKPN